MAHIHEKIDYAADTYIVNEGAVLLRLHDKYKIWLAPGGHIELDEDPPHAALREVKEEVGLDVRFIGEVPEPVSETGEKELAVPRFETELLSPRFLNRHRVSETHEHIAFIYFATSDTRETKQGETEISDGLKWFTKEELDDPQYQIKERIKRYAKAALDAAEQELTK